MNEEENKAREDLLLGEAVRELFGGAGTEEIIGRLTAMAQRSAEDYPDAESRLSLVRDLIGQEAAIREEEPDFDLEKEIRASAPFRALILVGEPVCRAREYVEPDRLKQRIEQEVIDRIRRRNARPEAMGLQNGASHPKSAGDMTDEEILRIGEELKRGHKVYIA